MWRGFVAALVAYGLANCREWTRRGYSDTVAGQLLAWTGGAPPEEVELPPWFGLAALHLSHRSALVRKDPAFYRPLFGSVPDDLPYYWPAPSFPRWPIRPSGPLEPSEARELLGSQLRPAGQDELVAALRAHRDVIFVAGPDGDPRTVGLVAGLARPGRTLWISPSAGASDGPVPSLPEQPWRAVTTVSSPAIARAPRAADELAMLDEARASDWIFRAPDEPVTGNFTLIVLDDAQRLGSWQRPAEAPVLAIAPRSDGAQQAALTQALHLHEPAMAGGGWDPGAGWLAARYGSPAVRRRLLAEVVRQAGPALVLVASRDRVDRVADGLEAQGLRAAGWAPTMRAATATAAISGWRTRRLDALVVPAGPLPPLGRRPLPLLMADTPASLDQWRGLLAQLIPARGVLLAGPDGPADVRDYATSTGCRRRALLEPTGEPVVIPCGRCEVCAPDGTFAGSEA